MKYKSRYSILSDVQILLACQVVPVQQQTNSSDCGVFAATFATCLAYGIHPETMQFDVPKMRNHLYQSLKSGVLKMFPKF